MKKKMVMFLCVSTMLTAMPLTAGAAEVEMMDATVQESAESETAEGLTVPELSDWKYAKNESQKTVILYEYRGDLGDDYSRKTRIRVPATYIIEGESYTVEVANSTFAFTFVEEVEFENGVKYDDYTFGNSRIIYGNNERPVGLFECCFDLEKANIPDGVTDCSSMFYRCNSLTEVPEIPDGVTDCHNMFYGCSSLTEAPEIPAGVTDCDSMFEGCSNLTEAPDIPAGVTDCSRMFYGCSSLTEAPDIPAGVTDCHNMFYGCSSLTEAPEKIPDSVDLSSGMFKDCSKLSGSMNIMGSIRNVNTEYVEAPAGEPGMFWSTVGMFENAATEGSGLTIYYADGVNIDEILATKSENSKITAKALSEKPTPDNPTPVPDTPTPDNPTPTPDTPTPASGSVTSAGIYVDRQDNNGVVAGLVTESTSDVDKEYRWLCYDIEADTWSVYSDWTLNNEWVLFNPGKAGDYLLQGEVRCAGMTEAEKTDCIGVNHHPNIKGKCQMPYTGEGGGYLIGLESYDNADYQYEMLILDCTLLAEGKDAWTYTTGKCKVDGNGFWTIWQPQYGYYWTLFRVYDKDGNLIDQDCYGFQNI